MEIYEPREDSYLLLKYVEHYAKGSKKVLDMGTGTGIQAMAAAKHAKQVLAVDINANAIKCARMSAEIDHIKNIKFITSDLFTNIPLQQFDLIIFNPPYLPKEEKLFDNNLFSGKRGSETTVRFLDLVTEYLHDDGTILLISSSLTDQKIIRAALETNLLVSEILETEHIFFEDIFVILIKKSDLLKKLNKKGIKGAKLYAKGKRGIILKAKYNHCDVAIKSANPKSTAHGTIFNETKMLKNLNKHNIGPNLIMEDPDFFVYNFVQGIFIDDYISKNSKKKIISVLKKIFRQLYKMDKLHVNKFEMHRPHKHIIISEGNPVMIDFERARFSEHPKNISQFCDYLIGNKIHQILKDKKIQLNKNQIIKDSSDYKRMPSKTSYYRLLKHLR